jgi:primosomal protein N' (replication factor Y)
MKTRYASVCIDSLHGELDRLFHYIIPAELDESIQVGKRCVVPFGLGNKPTTGYIIGLSDETETDPTKLKTIFSLPDDFCVLTAETLGLALWMQKKYYTTLISCIRCITPTAKVGKAFPGTRRSFKVQEVRPTSVQLTDEQRYAVDQITAVLSVKKSAVFLLHGVTGSGKTEVYLHAISLVLAQKKQAIVLVPEIALTPQTVNLFTARFGNAVAVTHSRLTAGERFAIWKQALTGAVSLVIGPRSAVFAPFDRLGLIVIDEEHEHTYHSEQSPKYDTRAVAVKRAELAGAVVVMGSATPSMESYLQAVEPGAQGLHSPDPGVTYTLLRLPHRINLTFPEVHIIDMRKEFVRGNTSLFARDFADALKETLDAGKQAILFLNRRGYSTFVSCRWCGEVLSCDQCRVNYTYHANTASLLCHYCGRGLPLPEKCPSCSSVHLRRFGVGTQQVETEVVRLFPGTATLRMDMDTTKGKFGHADILAAFRRGVAQVLIGTQMVAKGLDFPNVSVVGIMAADAALHMGDFSSAETAYQLITQVSGRAGRAETDGTVYIQTYNPEHYSVKFAENTNYEKFYEHEIAVREQMNYPPFSHFFHVLFTGKNEKEVITSLHVLADLMNKYNRKGFFTLYGPAPAFVSKVKDNFRHKLIAKGCDEELLKKFGFYCLGKLKEAGVDLRGITVSVTVDPTSLA